MGDLGLVLKFGIAYSMAHPLMIQRQEDWNFEDYAQKSQVVFDWEDMGRVHTPEGDLQEAEVKDALQGTRIPGGFS